MLKDFSKINTFLTVVREKSFSKASKKLGISQPAVTQQIKLLESFVQTGIVDRKKNGIGLTKEGKELYKIAQKLERFLNSTEKEILQIMDKKITFVLGTTHTVGKYIVPYFLGGLKEAIDNDVNVKMNTSDETINLLLDRKIDLALVGDNYVNSSIVLREWIDDELVLFSRAKLPPFVKKEDLTNFGWITREEDSSTYKAVAEQFEENGIEHQKFDVVSSVNSSAVIKQTILKTAVGKKPLVSFISKHAIKEELETGKLFTAKIRGLKLKRKLYIAYLKDEKRDAFVERAVNYIIKKRSI